MNGMKNIVEVFPILRSSEEGGQRCFELFKERFIFMGITAKDAQCSCLFSHYRFPFLMLVPLLQAVWR